MEEKIVGRDPGYYWVQPPEGHDRKGVVPEPVIAEWCESTINGMGHLDPNGIYLAYWTFPGYDETLPDCYCKVISDKIKLVRNDS